MSYLDRPRFHFVGRFLADTNTIDNLLANFAPGANVDPGWNPFGGNNFKLTGCTVTASVMDPAPSGTDPIVGSGLISTDAPYPAKMVDLDPDQRFISEIWGLTVRLSLGQGSGGFTAAMLVAGLTDMWANYLPLVSVNPANDPQHRALGGLCAAYQSVLQAVTWGDVSGSPLLSQLQQVSPDQLSIRFVLDAFDTNPSSATKFTGRIRGTIGPAYPNEADHFPTARRLFNPNYNPNSGPAYGAAFAQITRNPTSGGMLTLDLGNSIPTWNPNDPSNQDPFTSFGGPVQSLNLQLVAQPPAGGGQSPPPAEVRKGIPLVMRAQRVAMFEPGQSAATSSGPSTCGGGSPTPSSASTVLQSWQIDPDTFSASAGIYDFPLTDAQVAAAVATPIAVVLLTSGGTGSAATILGEDPQGRFVDCDTPCVRMSPGDTATCSVRTMIFGQPTASIPVALTVATNSTNPAIPPWSSQPASALTIGPVASTGQVGVYEFTLTAGDPSPKPAARQSIDGNVFFLAGDWDACGMTQQVQGSAVSVLIHDPYAVPAAPTWDDVQPILSYYSRMYPAMRQILDLSDYQMVRANARAIAQTLSLPIEDPHFMPVLRDLSENKKQMILKWIENGTPQGTSNGAQS